MHVLVVDLLKFGKKQQPEMHVFLMVLSMFLEIGEVLFDTMFLFWIKVNHFALYIACLI